MMNGTSRNVRDYLIRLPSQEQVMAINTGLSVTVVGHLVSLERDEAAKVAKVVVTPIKGHVVTGLEGEAIKVAADLLARRARRFLGDWKVIDWQQPVRVLNQTFRTRSAG